MTITEKYDTLLTLIAGHGSAVVAFSGGVDSSFLCHAAFQALGKDALAVTIVSPMLPKSELDAAAALARQVGIEHILVQEDEIDEAVAANPKDRCYH
ncbi:MAG: 7-cyano-7-deazaguanine synthase, partial [Treponema sp.]|nr:7-cyano-7-deazaguanine synthase [Treponema sp.]